MGLFFSTASSAHHTVRHQPPHYSQPTQLPDLSLFGNQHINGFYHLPQDQQKAIENDKNSTNHHIPVRFKHMGHELENIKKTNPVAAITDDPEDSDRDDEKQLGNQKLLVNNDYLRRQESQEFRTAKFEWVYFIGDDGPHPISQELRGIATEYEQARQYLALHNPLPDVSGQATMGHKVMKALIDTWINQEHEKHLHCRVIVKPLPDDTYHPGLLIWMPQEGRFGERSSQKAILIQLVTLNEAASDEQKDDREFEVQCDVVLRWKLDRRGWQYLDATHPTQSIILNNGLTDIAHWCLGYEMKHGYNSDCFTDCGKFMVELCGAFNIKHGDQPWSNTVLPSDELDGLTACHRWCPSHC